MSESTSRATDNFERTVCVFITPFSILVETRSGKTRDFSGSEVDYFLRPPACNKLGSKGPRRMAKIAAAGELYRLLLGAVASPYSVATAFTPRLIPLGQMR